MVYHLSQHKGPSSITTWLIDQVIREFISNLPEGMNPKLIIDSIVINDPKLDLPPIARSEARVFVLYRSVKNFTVAANLVVDRYD